MFRALPDGSALLLYVGRLFVCGGLEIVVVCGYSRTSAAVSLCGVLGIVVVRGYSRAFGIGPVCGCLGILAGCEYPQTAGILPVRGGLGTMADMKMSIWIRGARLKTLPLALSPVIIGTALSGKDMFADSQGGDALPMQSPVWFVVVAILCGCVALFLQIAANFANDYSDGIRGTDEGRTSDMSPGENSDEIRRVREGPHGPIRLVASGVNPRKVLAAAGINALIACICGLGIIALTGYWWLVLVGVACLLAGWFYVGGRHPYGYHYLGEVFVFVFFGLVATCGTMFALTGTISGSGIWGGSAAGCIAVAVLCVNNLRDVESDRLHGKHTWMSAMGRSKGTIFTIVLIAMSAIMTMLYCVAVLRNAHIASISMAGFALMSVIVLFIMCVMHVLAVAAIARNDYKTALPLCSLCSLVLAAAFAVSSISL